MEFNNQNGATVQNGTAKETTSKASQHPAAAKATKQEAEKPKPIPAKDEKAEAKPEQPKEEPHPVAEKPQDEVQPSKSALNLEGTLKVVADLHRRSIQRINLIARINQLEAFEVVLAQEHDELEENPYQGCKLIIEDDKQRRFVTTTPGLIRLVSQFIYTACHEKLAEIEAMIIFPKA